MNVVAAVVSFPLHRCFIAISMLTVPVVALTSEVSDLSNGRVKSLIGVTILVPLDVRALQLP